ncbi:hypothetical protein CDN99_25660 [Roseateles aquatilis]|uniref:Replication-associated protein ORF2/G2P domain-containing protein n=1 Tax=Roseateles aquatilis TaxID=431061 RepID=A0A246IUF4_9BURK|nr:hypothetical protein [Roseateles aquatilis]OWQ83855.1 hypothetical protein CDN99_25660 [Roseateles aquatilis]
MLRLIDGIFYRGKRSDEYVLRSYHLGNGHKEAVITRQVVWEEQGPATLAELAMWELERVEFEDEKREANRLRAARRAKTQVRRRVKVLGLDALLTLTYRVNQQDLTLCKQHMKEFVRRVRRVLPGFVYVAAFERQKRGAWHVHMAIHRLPQSLPWAGVKVKSYNVIRAVWRSVVGDLGGNIDESRKKRWSKQSSGKLAAYLSKYMLKAFEEGDDWSNRYSGSAGVELPQAVVVRFKAYSMAELVALAYGEVADGPCECMTWLDGYGDTFFLSTEGPPA